MKDPEYLYFGCWDRPGHYLVDNHGYSVHSIEDRLPWLPQDIDCKMQPGCRMEHGRLVKGAETEGVCRVHHKDGWTAISMWDRSIDGRGGCNSTFMAKGEFSFEQMVVIAKEQFPKIVKRFHFEMTPEVPS